jgi:hypothetical protein
VGFAHGLVRDAVYQAQSPDAVAIMHRRVAKTLEPAATSAVLFFHWRLSAGPDSGRYAAAHALVAGRAAMDGLAFEQARAPSATNQSEPEKVAFVSCPAGTRVHGSAAIIVPSGPGLALQVAYPSA